MNHKQRHTLDAICREPVGGNLHWRDVESLLKALGAEIQVTRGARVTFLLGGIQGTVHRPHHGAALSKQDVHHLREILGQAGIV